MGENTDHAGGHERGMDTGTQLYEQEASGWQRGLYDDVKHTFRAPLVNWIFRTTIANHPDFVRYAWAQVKPAFQTRQFGRTSVAYRDAILSAVEAGPGLPAYRCDQLEVGPAEYGELRGQLATYDVVAPRLAVLFELIDRSVNDRSVGTDPDQSRAATEPLPPWLDATRGRPPTMVAFDEPPEAVAAVIEDVQTFHGLEDGLPSIYRTLAQWPSFLERLWTDIEQRLESDGFRTARERTDDLVASFVDSSPYRPRLAPDDLERSGFDEGSITAVQEVFQAFSTGPAETVLPALPIFAATVDATGERDIL